MPNNTTTTALFAELDHRDSDGIEVSLLWNRSDNSLSVYVCDTRSDEAFEFTVEPSEAREAFQHPYAYAARLGTFPANLEAAAAHQHRLRVEREGELGLDGHARLVRHARPLFPVHLLRAKVSSRDEEAGATPASSFASPSHEP